MPRRKSTDPPILKARRPGSTDRGWPARCALRSLAVAVVLLATSFTASAQFGGGGPGGGGAGGANAPAPDVKPKFREHIHSQDGLPIRREKKVTHLVADGDDHRKPDPSARTPSCSKIETRKDRFYDYETVLGDVRRLNDMGSFDHVTFELDKRADGCRRHVHSVRMSVRSFHASRLSTATARSMIASSEAGRGGLNPSDPRSEFAIESARRRIVQFYREQGFNQVAISINDRDQQRSGCRHLSHQRRTIRTDRQDQYRREYDSCRMRRFRKSHQEPWTDAVGLLRHVGNKARFFHVIDHDVDVLGIVPTTTSDILTATVGRRKQYDKTGKWLTVTYVVNEGPQFQSQ